MTSWPIDPRKSSKYYSLHITPFIIHDSGGPRKKERKKGIEKEKEREKVREKEREKEKERDRENESHPQSKRTFGLVRRSYSCPTHPLQGQMCHFNWTTRRISPNIFDISNHALKFCLAKRCCQHPTFQKDLLIIICPNLLFRFYRGFCGFSWDGK